MGAPVFGRPIGDLELLPALARKKPDQSSFVDGARDLLGVLRWCRTGPRHRGLLIGPGHDWG